MIRGNQTLFKISETASTMHSTMMIEIMMPLLYLIILIKEFSQKQFKTNQVYDFLSMIEHSCFMFSY